MATLTYKMLRKLKAGEVLADPGCRGLRFIGGPKGVYAQLRFKDESGWHSMGLGRLPDREELEASAAAAGRGSYHFDEAVEDFRRRAWEKKKQARGGIDPREPDKNSLRVVAARYIEREAKKRNRSWAETERIFKVYINPRLGDVGLDKVTRRDVAELLDAIEDRKLKDADGKPLGGPVMADRTLAALRRLFNWHAARDDRFTTPIVKGMARTKPSERARDRVLSDQEIRDLWAACDSAKPPIFGPYVRTLLLTAQRRDEVANMRRSEIEGSVWTIPAERYKTGRANVVPLSETARAIIAAQPVLKLRDGTDSDLVFTTNGAVAISGFTKAKTKLDAKMLALARERAAVPKVKLEPWTLHDLRRTAKTLMKRAGVSSDHSERVLGHVIPGVEGVYDKHDYVAEKRAALKVLAEAVLEIVGPEPLALPAPPLALPAPEAPSAHQE